MQGKILPKIEAVAAHERKGYGLPISTGLATKLFLTSDAWIHGYYDALFTSTPINIAALLAGASILAYRNYYSGPQKYNALQQSINLLSPPATLAQQHELVPSASALLQIMQEQAAQSKRPETYLKAYQDINARLRP